MVISLNCYKSYMICGYFWMKLQDAIRYENGREVAGSAIIVEWSKGNPRRSGPPSRDSRNRVSHKT